MEVTRIRALRGPNLWSHHTAIQAVVQCAPKEGAIADLRGFESRLRARFPEISPFQPIGHEDAVPLARVLELATLGLQAQAGCPVTFSCTKPTTEPGVFQVVVEYSEEAVGRLALELAQSLCQSAINDTPFDLAAVLHQLQELDEDVRLGPSTGSVVNAALARNIPYSRMTDGSMVRFGWGSKQRRIQAAALDDIGGAQVQSCAHRERNAGAAAQLIYAQRVRCRQQELAFTFNNNALCAEIQIAG